MPSFCNQLEWRVTSTAGPRGRIGHTFCSNEDGSKAYIYGGLSASDEVPPNYLDDFWEYDLATKEWRCVKLDGAVQSPRAFHTTVWYNNKMFIFGGCNGRGRFNKLFYITAKGKCELPVIRGTVPITRYCHSAVLYQGAMYVYGGKCGGRNSNRRLKDLYMYRLQQINGLPVGQAWEVCAQEGTEPEARSAHSAVVHRDSMLIFGGRNSTGNCCDDVHSYNFTTSMWRKYDITSSLFGRARNSCVVHNGFAILFGGWNGKKKLNDLILFHMDSGTVEKTDQLFPSVRECQVAVMCHNTMVVFGGRLRCELMTETLELSLSPKSVVDDTLDYFCRSGSTGLTPEQLSLLPVRLQQAHYARAQGIVVQPVDIGSTDSIGPEFPDGAPEEQ